MGYENGKRIRRIQTRVSAKLYTIYNKNNQNTRGQIDDCNNC